MPNCKHIKEDGSQCQAQAMIDKEFCFLHNQDTEVSEKRLEAQQQGGQNGKKYKDEPAEKEVKIDTMKDVTIILAETINAVRMNKMSPKRANTIGYLLNVAVKAIEKKDLEARLEYLETVIGKRE